MHVKASMDATVKIISTCIFVLLLVLIVFSFFCPPAESAGTWLLHWIGPLILSATMIICWLLAPRAYTLNKETLTIHRAAGNVVILTRSINGVRPLDTSMLAGTIRIFGVGGLFGYFGSFSIPAIGSTRFYASQNRNHVLIHTTDGKRLLITPDDLAFLEELRRLTTTH